MSQDYDVLTTYAIKRGDDFLRFGSYRIATVVDSPLKATLYARLTDARRRIDDNDRHWIDETEPTPASQLRVVEVTVLEWEEEDV